MRERRLLLGAYVIALLNVGCSAAEPAAGSGGSAGNAPGSSVAGRSSAGGAATPVGGGATANSAGTTSTGAGGSSAGVAGSPAGGSPPAAGGTPGAGGGAAGSSPMAGGPAFVQPQVVTSTEGAYWKAGQWTEATDGAADVTVNDGSAAQSWEGFGGSFNEKGWEYLMLLSDADRAQALNLLFGVDGARFNYGRIPMGASDYATDAYTLNENKGDTAMAMFSIERDKKNLIPFVKAAVAVKPDVHLWASPWTPPTWMKSNGAFNRGRMNENAANFSAYALYFSKFVQEYAKEGLKIEAVHPQNEPGFEQDYPSCLWTGAGMADFIGNYLGPQLEKDGLTTQIFVGTMSNSMTDTGIMNTVTANTAAMKYVKGFGLQWGMLSSASGLRSRNMPIWQTEHKCGNYPWKPAEAPNFNASRAPNDFAYGVESWGLIRDWIKAGVTSYSAWNMVLDVVGVGIDKVRNWPQNALLVVDKSAKKLTPTPAFYVFRHFSQFVQPGAKVVSTTGGDALAFKNPDGTIVAVLYNSGGAKKAIVSMGGKKLAFDLPARGWATVNSK